MGQNRHGLALFFTLGVSLVDWERAGFLEREVNYYRQLAEHIGPVTFVTYGGAEDRAIADKLGGIRLLVNEHRLPPESFMREAPMAYRDALRGVAIVKSNQIKGAWAALAAAALTGAHSIVRGGYLLSRFSANRPTSLRVRFGLWRRELSLFHQADRVFLPSREDALYARRWYALPAEKVIILPNFVDVDLFAPRDDLACEPGLIGFVGRLAPQKNLSTLIEAAAGIPGVRLRLIGDGPERERLKALAQQRGVTIDLLGTVPHHELPRLLAECEIFVLPSLYEGAPKALLEAMSAALPVIATKVQGSHALIRHRETGWLCEDTSAASLRRALETLLHDSRLRTQMGRAARRFVVEHFSLPHVLQREVTAYRELGCA